jgi:hypothetical protein
LKQVVHLGPFRGLNSTYGAEAAQESGTWMRGGYNVEVIDGEWWVRHGLAPSSERLGSIAWRWSVQARADVIDFLVLCADNYVLIVNAGSIPNPGMAGQTEFDQIRIPYDEAANVDLVVDEGSTSATISATNTGSAAARQVFVDGSGSVDRLYRIVALSGAVVTLDRPYEGTSGTLAALDLFASLFGAAGDHSPSDNIVGGCCLFEQTVQYTGGTPGDLGWNHVDVGGATITIYVIVHSRGGIAAVPLLGGVVVTDFVRQTQISAPTSVETGTARVGPVVYKDRLIVAANDPSGGTGEQTIWYSRPNDFMVWHTGLQNLGGIPNYITFSDPTAPISGLGVLGEQLVVHRRDRQEILQPYGEGFRPYTNRQGFGFWPKDKFVVTGIGHIGWTRYGPALLNDGGIRVLFPDIENMLQSFMALAIFNKASTIPVVNVRLVLHDEQRRRVCFVLGAPISATEANVATDFRRVVRHQDADSITQENRSLAVGATTVTYTALSPVLVVDYARGNVWLEEHIGIYGSATFDGRLYFAHVDGTLAMHPSGYSGKDFDIERVNAAHAVDAAVETQWLEHGTPLRKKLQKLWLTFRALDVDEDVAEITGGKFNPLRVSDLWDATTDTLHIATLEIMADEKEDTVRASFDINVPVATMLARSLEGNRMLPLMLFEATPRAAGRSFKYRFKNALSAAATAAGHKKGHFRLVDIVAELDVEESTRAAGSIGGE